MIQPRLLPSSPGVYLIRNTVNGKVYVGSTMKLRGRVHKHLNALQLGTHSNRHLRGAWQKYGAGAFECEVLETLDGCDLEQLRAREDYWLQHYRSYGREHGYNLNRSAMTGNEAISDETRQLLSQLRTGRNLTPEARAKLSAKRTGIVFTDEHRENIRKARARQVITPEQRERQSQALKGRKPSEATIQGARERNSRIFRVIDPDGNWEVIRNLTDFCRQHGLMSPKMLAVSRGEFGQHRGWSCEIVAEPSGFRVGDKSKEVPPTKKARRRPTHCVGGHEFTEENSYRDSLGRTHCLACARERATQERTHCKYGHPFVEDTVVPGKRRRCHTCLELRRKGRSSP